MDQPTLVDLEYDSKKRKTRREILLDRVDGLIPWERLESWITEGFSRMPTLRGMIPDLTILLHDRTMGRPI